MNRNPATGGTDGLFRKAKNLDPILTGLSIVNNGWGAFFGVITP
jgi:hypothetical protein